jgi:hypothetical protein
MDNSQTIEEWIKEHGFKLAQVKHEGKKISLHEYLSENYTINEDTIQSLKEDFETPELGFKELEFIRPSLTKKWRALGNGGEVQGPPPEIERYDMVEFRRETELIVRFPQAGKTGLMIRDLIAFHKKYENTSIISVGIMVSDNSLLLNNQTCLRASEIDMLHPLRISSKPLRRGENYPNSVNDDVFNYLEKRLCNTLFYCGHSARTRADGDINNLLDSLARFAKQYCIAIFIDEADKVISTKMFETSVTRWLEKKTANGRFLVEQFKFVTATPCDISPAWGKVKNWVGKHLPEGKIRIQYVDSLHGADYHVLSASKHIPHELDSDDENSDISNYVGSYLAKKSPVNGEVWLIPGSIKVQSHEEIAERCMSDNPKTGEPYFTDILVINSKTKQMSSSNTVTDDEDDEFFDSCENEIQIQSYDKKTMWGKVSVAVDVEIKEWLKTYWLKNGSKRRLVITGNRCLGRGITFSSHECNISVGLFGPYCSKGGSSVREKYQLFNRLAGYTRNAMNKPSLVCSVDDFHSMEKYESLLRKLLELGQNPDESIRELTDEKVEQIVSQINMEFDPSYDANSWEHEWREFRDKKLAEKWLPKNRKIKTATEEPGKPGFYQSSFTGAKEVLKYQDVVNAMQGIDNGMRRKTMNLPWKSAVDKKPLSRVYLVYKDLDDPKSYVYICRKLRKVR